MVKFLMYYKKYVEWIPKTTIKIILLEKIVIEHETGIFN